MGGDLAADGIEIGGVDGLQGLGHPAVQQAAASRLQCPVGSFAQLVVAEIIGIEASLAHDASLPEFVQLAGQVFLIDVVALQQQGDGKLASDGGGQAGELSSWGRKLG